jgi:hypothetical protein
LELGIEEPTMLVIPPERDKSSNDPALAGHAKLVSAWFQGLFLFQCLAFLDAEKDADPAWAGSA